MTHENPAETSSLYDQALALMEMHPIELSKCVAYLDVIPELDNLPRPKIKDLVILNDEANRTYPSVRENLIKIINLLAFPDPADAIHKGKTKKPRPGLVLAKTAASLLKKDLLGALASELFHEEIPERILVMDMALVSLEMAVRTQRIKGEDEETLAQLQTLTLYSAVVHDLAFGAQSGLFAAVCDPLNCPKELLREHHIAITRSKEELDDINARMLLEGKPTKTGTFKILDRSESLLLF